MGPGIVKVVSARPEGGSRMAGVCEHRKARAFFNCPWYRWRRNPRLFLSAVDLEKPISVSLRRRVALSSGFGAQGRTSPSQLRKYVNAMTSELNQGESSCIYSQSGSFLMASYSLVSLRSPNYGVRVAGLSACLEAPMDEEENLIKRSKGFGVTRLRRVLAVFAPTLVSAAFMPTLAVISALALTATLELALVSVL